MKSEEIGSFNDIYLKNIPIPVTYNGDEDYDKHDIGWQKTRRFAEDTKHRKGLVSWVKFVVTSWLACVLFVVTFNSKFCFNLSDTVLITLLTTTTVNILGLAYIVLKGLFQLHDSER